MSTQDDALREHFFAFIGGNSGEFGPDAVAELRGIFARSRRRGEAAGFGTYLARLMIEDDAQYFRTLRSPRIATEGSAS